VIARPRITLGQRPNMPTPFLPYIQAKRLALPTEQLTLG
jgi:hypothetical protein